MFKVMGQDTTGSLGMTEIRLPISSNIALTFDVDVVDHDVPILFGLEQHKRFKCSSNEVENTFMHHPTNMTLLVDSVNVHQSKEGIFSSLGLTPEFRTLTNN